jgi:hypothetical protein
MVREMKLADGSVIYVDVSEVEALPALTHSTDRPNVSSRPLPTGAEPTSFAQDALLGGALLKETIAGVAQSAFDSLKQLQPDEWSVEFAIGMKADKVRVIPVLLTGSGEASLKVTAKWIKTKV